MNCEKALELISAELDGELTQQERAELQAHLDACPDCRETYAQLHELDAALQESELEPPTALHDGDADDPPGKEAPPACLAARRCDRGGCCAGAACGTRRSDRTAGLRRGRSGVQRRRRCRAADLDADGTGQ